MANPTQFTWVDPTTNTDGSAVAAGEITGYTIGVGVASGNYTMLTPVSSPTATSEPLSSLSSVLAPGTYFAAIRAESTGGPSAFSNEVSFAIAAPVPNPPTGFTVA